MWSKYRVLFVCHGNICRSPMAEFIFGDIVRRAGLDGAVEVLSAGTSAEELGNPVYPEERAYLRRLGIDPGGKRAGWTKCGCCGISRTSPGTSRTRGTAAISTAWATRSAPAAKGCSGG